MTTGTLFLILVAVLCVAATLDVLHMFRSGSGRSSRRRSRGGGE